MADLIGDIDPIKAANLRLDYADERVIHYGIIPRTNRGIFCINELPDLAPRIQVGLLNIMEERDVQIRGFPVRLPMDVVMVFTANPEDYTNRGSIITPLKDRIESQIHTHYPRELSEAMKITGQEAWSGRAGGGGGNGVGPEVVVPGFLREAVEMVAFEARKNEFLDQSSGVSARLPIALLECVVSNAERRAVVTGAAKAVVRPIDFQQAVAAITGKIELVYQGEQHGALNVARHLVGRGLRAVFEAYLPDVDAGEGGDQEADDQVFGPYKPIVDYFGRGGKVEVVDDASDEAVLGLLKKVEGLEQLALKHVPMDEMGVELVAAMEFVLEGLHQARMIGKDDVDGTARYYDMMGDVLEGIDTDR